MPGQFKKYPRDCLSDSFSGEKMSRGSEDSLLTSRPAERSPILNRQKTAPPPAAGEKRVKFAFEINLSRPMSEDFDHESKFGALSKGEIVEKSETI